ncbi:MAG: N-acetylmuramoyl-L-alanine amidase [Longicatena sp.]
MKRNFVQKHLILCSLIIFCFVFIPSIQDSYGQAKSDDISVKVEEKKEVINKKTVVIDAGHGGYDGGSESRTNSEIIEKNIALDVSLKIGAYLEKHNINVVYTRTSDSVSWSENNAEDLIARSNIANNANANCFVSIHTNYSEDDQDQVKGNEVWLRYTNDDNIKLASAINDELSKLTYTENRGLKDEAISPLSLLRFNKMPSVLIELGFLSHRGDTEALSSSSIQTQIATSIGNGILSSLEGK